jgi:hypothetical protein
VHRPLSALVLAVALAAATLAGCGLTSRRIDGKRVETRIVAQTREKTGFTLDSIDCPGSRPAKAGDTFRCQAKLAGQPVGITVTQEDADGTVSYQPDEALLDVRKIVATIEQQMAAQAGIRVTPDCGRRKVLVKKPGETFDCDVSDSTGQHRTVAVRVTDLQGNLSLEVRQ